MKPHEILRLSAYGALLGLMLSASASHAADPVPEASSVGSTEVSDRYRGIFKSRLSMYMEQTPLEEIVEEANRQTEYPISLCPRAIRDEYDFGKYVFDVTIADGTLWDLVEQLCESGQLGFRILDERIQITNFDFIDGDTTSQVHRVDSLVETNDATVHRRASTELSQMIELTVSPYSWEQVGGSSVIRFFGDRMVVSAGDRVLGDVSRFVKVLAQAKTTAGAGLSRGIFVDDIKELRHEANCKIRDTLDSRVAFDMSRVSAGAPKTDDVFAEAVASDVSAKNPFFEESKPSLIEPSSPNRVKPPASASTNETQEDPGLANRSPSESMSLAAFLRHFSEQTQISVSVGDHRLEEDVANGSIAVVVDMGPCTARTRLQRVLEQLELDYEIRAGVLWLRPYGDDDDAALSTAAYPVKDLVCDGSGLDAEVLDAVLELDYPLGGNVASRPVIRFASSQNVPPTGWQLSELVQAVLRPEIWDTLGGASTMHFFASGDSLIVRTTEQMHFRISKLLDQLRKSRRDRRQPYAPLRDLRVDATIELLPLDSLDTTSQEVQSLLRNSLLMEPSPANQESVTVRGQTVRVRHELATLQRVLLFLDDASLIAAPAPQQGSGGGGFF